MPPMNPAPAVEHKYFRAMSRIGNQHVDTIGRRSLDGLRFWHDALRGTADVHGLLSRCQTPDWDDGGETLPCAF